MRRVDRTVFGFPFQRFFEVLEQEVRGCDSLLDIGCGEHSPISFFARRLPYTVGIDAFEPAIEKSRALGIHDEYRCMNVLDIEKEVPDQSFDCAVALDLIEHLTKEDGRRLLQAMERIARRKVVVFTPQGFLPQHAVGGNEFQRHRSGWEADEMRGMGYRVLGISGWKPLRGAEAKPNWQPRFLCERFSLLTEPFFERRPEHAFQILCIKEIV
ncbi:MAG: class I SAM-dependent methyltransferase [Pyrinomonadaceae bacterium]|nr:class I SAM-dependent methyltransferase [Pyrinomonadaceae bacterium]